MIEVEQIQPRLYQDILEIRDYVTQNSWGEHSDLKPGEYRQLLNVEIYDNFIKSRRGSEFLRPNVNPEKAQNIFIKQSKVWDVGDEQYLIYYQANEFFSQQVHPIVGNPTQINDFAGSPFTVGSVANAGVPDFVLEGGRLYVFHPDENAVIEWDPVGTVFEGRTMGMVPPQIVSVVATVAGNVQ